MADPVQKIGLGTVQFGADYGISNRGGRVAPGEVSRIIDYFRARGGQIIDTASAYGKAEEVLGSFDLKDFRVVSKWMPPEGGVSINDLLERTLKKLNVVKLYGYLAHRPQYVLENPGIWSELAELKSEGQIQKIGFSLNSPDELTALEKTGITPDIIQVPYNYFDRRFDSVCSTFRAKGGEVHTRSAFLQGLFFMSPDNLSSHFDEIKPILKSLQNEYSDLAGELLGFALENPWANAVIIGVENSAQLAENMESMQSVRGLPFFDKSISDTILNPSYWNL